MRDAQAPGRRPNGQPQAKPAELHEVVRGAEDQRVVFDVDFGGDALSELRLVLENGNKPVSETWLYRWTA